MPRTPKPSPDAAQPGAVIERITTAMAACGIQSAAELARRMNLPRQTIHRWLGTGIDNISYRHLLTLSDTLNVNARWLVFGEVGPIKQPYEHPQEAEAAAIAGKLEGEVLEMWLGMGRVLQGLQETSSARVRQPKLGKARRS